MPGFAHMNAPSLSMKVIASVEKLETRYDVYDIAVEDAHEFFANGILVHNCDEIASWRYPDSAWSNYQFGLRLGDHPQTVVTSTPKPTPFVRKLITATGTVVTRGTTYDNRANLAPSFFAQIIRDYEGTRLGRQELLAELLTDNPDALWNLDTMIEPYRVRVAPALERIVVAVDPATTSNATSDETGIIVAGRTSGGHFYVLDDRSLRASPDSWARAAVSAYHAYHADRIIAESNQGGDMVESTLRTVDPDVPIKLIHATRGKITRAEPVAALYEQGRGHHVGTFAALESQLTDWTPGQSSPDRLDAMVWAATELLLTGNTGEIAFGAVGHSTTATMPKPTAPTSDDPADLQRYEQSATVSHILSQINQYRGNT